MNPSIITIEGRTEFDAIKNDESVVKWFATAGFDLHKFAERDWKEDHNRYLLLKTEQGDEHNRLQDHVDLHKVGRQMAQIPGANTFDVVYVGCAKIYFFPRAGECQVRFRKSQTQPSES